MCESSTYKVVYNITLGDETWELVDGGVQRWTRMNFMLNFGSHKRSAVFLYEV